MVPVTETDKLRHHFVYIGSRPEQLDVGGLLVPENSVCNVSLCKDLGIIPKCSAIFVAQKMPRP
jgi:hypothetical protein